MPGKRKRPRANAAHAVAVLPPRDPAGATDVAAVAVVPPRDPPGATEVAVVAIVPPHDPAGATEVAAVAVVPPRDPSGAAEVAAAADGDGRKEDAKSDKPAAKARTGGYLVFAVSDARLNAAVEPIKVFDELAAAIAFVDRFVNTVTEAYVFSGRHKRRHPYHRGLMGRLHHARFFEVIDDGDLFTSEEYEAQEAMRMTLIKELGLKCFDPDYLCVSALLL